MRIGFIGVGTMGSPMARRLVSGGHDVTVFDTSPARVAELVTAGAQAATGVAPLGASAEVVLASLPNSAALEAAVLDETDGVLAAMASGSVFVDLSTNSWALAGRVAEACHSRGIGVVDAPVSSVSGPAEEGRLTVMVGGDADTVASVRPLLELIGTNIVHLGPSGAGTVGKVLTQYMALTNMVTGMEAMLAAAKAGVDLRAMLDLVPVSIGSSFMFRAVNQLAEFHDFGEPGKVNGLVEIMNKDLCYGVELAEQLGVPHGAGAAAEAVFAEAMRRGYGPYHFTRVAQSLEELAGVEIRLPSVTKDAS